MPTNNIEKAREKLNELIEKDSDLRSIQEASQEVDGFIVEFYKEQLEGEEDAKNGNQNDEKKKSDT